MKTRGECWCNLPTIAWACVNGDEITDYPDLALRGLVEGSFMRRLSDGQIADTGGRNLEGTWIAYEIVPEGRIRS